MTVRNAHSIDKLPLVARQAKNWFLNDALPLWGRVGRQPNGLRAEKMDEQGRPDPAYFRVFVQARHIYALACGGRLGYEGSWQKDMKTIMDLLLQRGKNKDGFFVHKLSKTGDVIDPQTDLYDQAFILLALSQCGWALSQESYFDEAQSLLNNLQTKWGHNRKGYYEGSRKKEDGVHQNPHMHLFEAFLSLYKNSKRACFKKAALHILTMAQNYFIDKKTGAILEDFYEDMSSQQTYGSIRVEPGHCLEWGWLLLQPLSRSFLSDSQYACDRMTNFARKYGIDRQRNVVINEVTQTGHILDEKARLWPQTERIRNAAARYLKKNNEEDLREMISGWKGLTQYFNPQHKGLWFDRMKKDGTFESAFSPGSSLYHIAGAVQSLTMTKSL